MDKLNFIKNEFPKLLKKLDPNAKGAWGVLNGLQMVEHMAESISFATGKNNQVLHTPAEQLPVYREFAMSEREFKPNTKNALMPEVPLPATKASMDEAIAEVEVQTAAFISYFENNKGATLTNSFFGELNFEEWLHLFHKHAVHHAKQFGLL
ncbi:MAG: hypothetical protein JWO09_1095 [Bacteroidetes bacterium]|nr:hypothetical protein [Bacteroidota bacterium]